VASDLDLSAPRRSSARFLPLALVPIALWVLRIDPPLIVLGAALVGGAGLTYAGGFELELEERLAYGAVLGAGAIALCQLALAFPLGVGLTSDLLGAALPLVAAAIVVWGRRSRLRVDLDRAWRGLSPRSSWPLWLLLALAWAWTAIVLSRAYTLTPQGLFVGGAAFYADWSAHLSYAGSFAYGHNLPPQFPLDPPHRLGYPFLIDFWAAELVPLGASLTSSLVLTSGFLGFAFPLVMYLAARRLSGSRMAGAVSVAVFCLGGGLGFLRLMPELWHQGPALLLHLPQLYTQDPALNLQWLNPVLAYLLPQRSVLFGFSLALIVSALLLGPKAPSPGQLGFLGIVTGLSPLAHVHSWGTNLALPAFSLRGPNRRRMLYFLPALSLGLPVVIWLLGDGAARLRWQVGWLAQSGGHHDNLVWFWIWNTGLLVPAMLAAFLWPGTLPPGLGRRLAPIWLWFVVPNFIVFQAWDWDNTKFFAYWALLGAIPVGALVARLIRRRGASALLAGVLFLSLVAAGTLDLARSLDASQNTFALTDSGGLEVARWARVQTSPHAIFLVAPDPNSPIPTLAGRSVVEGYPGWVWTYGLSDWAIRSRDVEDMLQGQPGTRRLLAHYRVGYVMIGPQELSLAPAGSAYWAASGYRRVYFHDGYSVYRI